MPKHPANRLAQETSPYLLQHAHNPVDWRPWGEEAFAEARRRDVPIFLSIGYSTCYWCHVMERESFESGAVARVMNEGFVCVKVDREERPDVDDIYMAAVQAFTRHGGWPMSLFLEPAQLKPFFAGTYFPPDDRHGMPAFTRVLTGMSAAWKGQREDVQAQAVALAGAVEEQLAAAAAPASVGRRQVAQAVSTLLRLHDAVHGGFTGGRGPKFPQPVYLDLLLGFRRLAGDEETLRAVDASLKRTLDAMACGGMFDQVGGGFHRYSVDEKWLVPHFEKMLYDNAQLAETYARAAVVYGDRFYERVTRRVLGYVLREMTLEGGAFASAQDAEVDGREGLNYLWTRPEIAEVLGKEDAAFATDVYGLDRGPNFQDPHHPGEPARNVLFLEDRPEAMAKRLGLTREAFLARLDSINATLLLARQARRQPLRDDKTLTGWNGLMVAAFAAAGAALAEPEYVRAARGAADRLLTTMRSPDGGLYRTSRAGTARVPAFLEDYAFLIHGLIEIHRAGGDEAGRYLDAAVELAGQVEERFGDTGGGGAAEGDRVARGYFDTLAGQSDLFVRSRSVHDGAVPSGSSVMLNALIDLHEVGGDARFLTRAGEVARSMSAAIAGSPVGAANATRGVMRLLATAESTEPDGGADAETDTPAAIAATTPVAVFASEERLTVREGEPVGLVLRFSIDEGYHINAAEPAPGADPRGPFGGLVGLRVLAVGGQGVRVYADYPEGDAFGEGGALRVHTGQFELPVVLEREGEWGGRPMLAVTYQACTESECLAPATIELDVALDKG